MKKIIFITDDLFIRNYIQSGVLDPIEDEETYYLASQRINHRRDLENKRNFLGYIEETDDRRELSFDLINTQMMRYNNRSTSFLFRLKRYNKRMQWKFRVLSLPVVSDTVTGLLRKRMGTHPQLKKIFENIKPDLIIFPSAVAGTMDIDTLTLAKQMNIKTLYLIDGWDNLSSKTVFLDMPDYVGVWGEQSFEHAVRIHGIPKERIFQIGTPRFDHYFKAKKEELKSPYPFSYVLFAGNAIAFDEISALKILDETVERMGIKNFKIVYRPHPWRQPRKCFDQFKESDFRHVILDEQMKEGYGKLQKNKDGQKAYYLPTLDYYPSLLNSALFLISPLSTMMIEAAIFDTPILAITYDDGFHWTSPHNAYKYYEHFKGIERIKALTLCPSKGELGGCFEKMYNRFASAKKDKTIIDSIRYFLHFDDSSYSQRLKNILNKIEHETIQLK